MGGFRLLGPNYTIQSLPTEITCKCPGYKGEISEEIETILVNNPEKKLDKSLIKSGNAHLGLTMHYKIISREEDEDFDKEREKLRKRKEEKQAKIRKKIEFDNWTPWDGKSLESINPREMEPVDPNVFKWKDF